MNVVVAAKLSRFACRKLDATLGWMCFSLERTLQAMLARPYILGLEFTNICNAKCVFCPYQVQKRPPQYMSDEVFEKAVKDFVDCGGGSVSLTPPVGEALVHPQFLDRLRYLRSLPGIDRVALITNAISVDRFGAEEILRAGVSSITVSTAGFEPESYARLYRSQAYQRMRDNVRALVEANTRLGRPATICIALRTDRRLREVMQDPDFQAILAHRPTVDFTWFYRTAGGRVTRDMLSANMKLRPRPRKTAPCESLYSGLMVLADGTVQVCETVGAMDAVEDLRIGNVLESSLMKIWAGPEVRELRQQFMRGKLNKTCATCDSYRNLDLYCSREGRMCASVSRARLGGKWVKRKGKPRNPFWPG